MKNYDAIIIGAGAGGGIVAGVLCEAGQRVLLLERGAALRFADVSRPFAKSTLIALRTRRRAGY